MLTIRTKLGFVFAGVIALTLTAVASLLILTERARVADDITQSTTHFAELSAESIGELYDLHYKNQSFAIFQSELATVLKKSPAVASIEIVTAEGNRLFDSTTEAGAKLDPVKDQTLLARLKVNRPSLATAQKTVYLAGSLHAAAGQDVTDSEGTKVANIQDGAEVKTIIYPLSDDSRRVVFHLSYSEVRERTLKSITYLAMLFAAGFAGSLLIATWFSRTLTAPLMALKAGAEEIAKGNLTAKISVKSNDETRVLADTFNQMTSQLSTTLDQKIGLERHAKELEVASEIQTSLLPKQVVLRGLDVATYFAPASAVGGDIYDCVHRAEGRDLFYVADVTGHGVPAGIVAAVTNAIMTTAAASDETLSDVLERANEIIHQKTNASIFVTMLALEWNSVQKNLTYLNAGHNPPLIFRAKERRVEITKTGTFGLGMFTRLDPPPDMRDAALTSGDVFFVFTDGIIEARNAANEMFGTERLAKLLEQAAATKNSAKEIAEFIRQEFDAFHGEIPPHDDVTFAVLKYV